ncbi:hypothetical protein F2Q68_00032603 [Brassica cretica]|uniref:Uncharacterized protein n=1 Tax=Brassica cretica TaxID=69181 RepID=A0A8S9GE39_BRACR|nr:hypothetical protein F2Q68_00032603 [Brassica cretica]
MSYSKFAYERYNKVEASTMRAVGEIPSSNNLRLLRSARSLRSDRASIPLKARSQRRDRAKARSQRNDRASVPLGRYVANELGQTRSLRSDRARAKAQSLRSDRAWPNSVAMSSVPLDRYVVTELFRNVETTPVHAFSSNLQCYLPKTVASSVYVFRYSKSLIKLCGLIPWKVRSLSKEIVINASSRKTAHRDLRHSPTCDFLTKARKP